jgi:hypothetical protein
VPFVTRSKNFKIFAPGQVQVKSTGFSCQDLAVTPPPEA